MSGNPMSGVDDKRSITAMLGITLGKPFLPMQLIYKGKSNQSLPKVNFPETFSLSVNEKHYSNGKESLKFWKKKKILPYIQNVRQILGSESQKAQLRLWDPTFQYMSLLRLAIIDLWESPESKTSSVRHNCTSLFNIVKERITKIWFISETQG